MFNLESFKMLLIEHVNSFAIKVAEKCSRFPKVENLSLHMEQEVDVKEEESIRKLYMKTFIETMLKLCSSYLFEITPDLSLEEYLKIGFIYDQYSRMAIILDKYLGLV